MEQTIATIEKNRMEEIRVGLSEYQGHDLVNLRIYANYDAEDSERKPTKKGVTLRVEKLPELIAALQETQREAEAAGLLKAKAEAA